MSADKQEEAKRRWRDFTDQLAFPQLAIHAFQSRLLEEIENRMKDISHDPDYDLDWVKELILTIKP